MKSIQNLSIILNLTVYDTNRLILTAALRSVRIHSSPPSLVSART